MSVTWTVVSCLRRLVSVVTRPFERHHLEMRLRELKAQRRVLRETADEYASKQWTMNWALAKVDLDRNEDQIEEVEEKLARW